MIEKIPIKTFDVEVWITDDLLEPLGYDKGDLYETFMVTEYSPEAALKLVSKELETNQSFITSNKSFALTLVERHICLSWQ